MKIQHLFFTSTIIILSIILIIQTRQIQISENTLNRIENNYSNLNTNLNTNLTNLNTSLTSLNSNITNLNNAPIAEQPIPIIPRPPLIRATQSHPRLLIRSSSQPRQELDQEPERIQTESDTSDYIEII